MSALRFMIRVRRSAWVEPLNGLVKQALGVPKHGRNRRKACSISLQLPPHELHLAHRLSLAAMGINDTVKITAAQPCGATNLLEVFAWASDTTTAFATGPNCANAASKACSLISYCNCELLVMDQMQSSHFRSYWKLPGANAGKCPLH